MQGADEFADFDVDDEAMIAAAEEVEREHAFLRRLEQTAGSTAWQPALPPVPEEGLARAVPARALFGAAGGGRFTTPVPQVKGARRPPLLNGVLAITRGVGGTSPLMSLLGDRSCPEVEEEDFFSPLGGAPSRANVPRDNGAAPAGHKRKAFVSPCLHALDGDAENGPAKPAVAPRRQQQAEAASALAPSLPSKSKEAARGGARPERVPKRAAMAHAAAPEPRAPSAHEQLDELLDGVSLFAEPPPPPPPLDPSAARDAGQPGQDDGAWGACVFDEDDDAASGMPAQAIGDAAFFAPLSRAPPVQPAVAGGSLLPADRAAELARADSIDIDLTLDEDDGAEADDGACTARAEQHARATTPASALGRNFTSPVAGAAAGAQLTAPSFMRRPRALDLTELAPGVSIPGELARQLRPHQREGVIFLAAGLNGDLVEDQHGVVLGDVPGLGKSAQIIGTMLACRSWLRKALIVCPVSLVDNWIAEFRKWAPDVQLPSKIIGPNGTLVAKTFVNYKGDALRVVLGSYERMRGDMQNLLSRAGINLVVCDEAHRLKNMQTQEYKAVAAIGSSGASMILVTGTPVQNNAGEFYAMTSLALPGVLGSWPSFKHKYEDPMASGKMSEALLRELKRETSAFILRRGESILRQWLPARREVRVFCKLTPAQSQLYVETVDQWASARQAGGKSDSLRLVGDLHKIVAHPRLAAPNGRGAAEPDIELMQSGKLRVVRAMLRGIFEQTTEKVLLTSNYCSSLDLLARLAHANRWPYLRVDGKVTVSKRQELIDEFNGSSRSSHFLFLLSARAGGAGLNITGASRLIIFEPSWNPAIDAQCAGRIWRLGQEREVVVTKLIGTSTIDELIVQRQQAKLEISGMLVDRNESTERVWTAEELAFVAAYNPATYSRLAEERGTAQSLVSGDALIDALSIPDISHIEVVPDQLE